MNESSWKLAFFKKKSSRQIFFTSIILSEGIGFSQIVELPKTVSFNGNQKNKNTSPLHVVAKSSIMFSVSFVKSNEFGFKRITEKPSRRNINFHSGKNGHNFLPIIQYCKICSSYPPAAIPIKSENSCNIGIFILIDFNKNVDSQVIFFGLEFSEFW